MYLSTQLTEDRKNVIVWERGPDGKRVAVYYDSPYEFFVENEESEQEYYSLTGKKLEKIEFTNPYDFYRARKNLREAEIELYESDISAELKVLSDNYYKQPLDGELHVTFYDIEVDYDPARGHSRPDDAYARISSIALYHKHTDESIVLALRPKKGKWAKTKLEDLPEDLFDHSRIELLDSEKELLMRFYEEIGDSDVVSGWNSFFFDDPYIYSRTLKVLGKKYTKLMNFPESTLDVRVDEKEKYGTMEMVVKPHGRIWIDFMEMVKKFDASERDSHSLEAVAEESLDGFKKLSYDKSLYHLYHDDFDEFLRYNIRDTDILKHLDLKFKYMNLALNFSHMVTNNIPAVLGTTSTSDTAILNFCKHECDKRLVLPDAPTDVFDDGKKFEGAFVLDPLIGLHEWISSVDIKSLYPSSMRAINISPETIIGQFFENEKAFEYIGERAEDIHLTLLYEDGVDETMTAKEWKKAFEDRQWAISGHGTVFDQSYDGIIPSILTKWFDERIEYQKLKNEAYAKYEKTNDLKDKKYAEYYDNIQYLKKIQLNSLYGVFGNKFFRFFDERLAMSTTKTGKNVLLHMAKKIAQLLDGDYKYPSKSILYGDTDSIYFRSDLEEENVTLEDVSTISNAICEKVNKSYPKFMKDAFNCLSGRENYIVAEKEIVSDRGIFVRKKHYILHLVELDGKSVDKMKVMGLQIKKTNIPKHIRIKLTEFFERFLKGEDWIVIKRDIVDYKKSLKEGELLNIGIPSGVNDVEEGTFEFKRNPDAQVYHMVLASIMYNDCLDTYNDHESFPIKSGDKVRKFYFYKKKNFGPFNAIALPVDMDLMPEWLDEFTPYIDRNRQIQSLVDNPIKNILKAIGEAVPNSRNTLADELIVF